MNRVFGEGEGLRIYHDCAVVVVLVAGRVELKYGPDGFS